MRSLRLLVTGVLMGTAAWSPVMADAPVAGMGAAAAQVPAALEKQLEGAPGSPGSSAPPAAVASASPGPQGQASPLSGQVNISPAASPFMSPEQRAAAQRASAEQAEKDRKAREQEMLNFLNKQGVKPGGAVAPAVAVTRSAPDTDLRVVAVLGNSAILRGKTGTFPVQSQKLLHLNGAELSVSVEGNWVKLLDANSNIVFEGSGVQHSPDDERPTPSTPVTAGRAGAIVKDVSSATSASSGSK